ncbi:hypothetical protein EMCRGX_G029188 [Ephydatia muelleri]
MQVCRLHCEKASTNIFSSIELINELAKYIAKEYSAIRKYLKSTSSSYEALKHSLHLWPMKSMDVAKAVKHFVYGIAIDEGADGLRAISLAWDVLYPEQTLRDTVVHTFNFDKKRRNSGSSDLLLVSVLSFLLQNLESSNANDRTIMKGYRRVAIVEELYHILKQIHDKDCLHAGSRKTYAKVQSLYSYIPRVVVEKYVSLCSTCSLRKPQHTKAPLRPIIADGLFSRIQIDLIDMRHMPHNGCNWILHIVDHWSKFNFAFPLVKKKANHVVKVLHNYVFPVFGLPAIIHSDNGKEFVNKLVGDVVSTWPEEADEEKEEEDEEKEEEDEEKDEEDEEKDEEDEEKEEEDEEKEEEDEEKEEEDEEKEEEDEEKEEEDEEKEEEDEEKEEEDEEKEEEDEEKEEEDEEKEEEDEEKEEEDEEKEEEDEEKEEEDEEKEEEDEEKDKDDEEKEEEDEEKEEEDEEKEEEDEEKEEEDEEKEEEDEEKEEEDEEKEEEDEEKEEEDEEKEEEDEEKEEEDEEKDEEDEDIAKYSGDVDKEDDFDDDGNNVVEKDLEGTYVGTVASQSECNVEERNKTTAASDLPDSEVCDDHESDYDQDGNNNGHVALLKSNSRVLATTEKHLPVRQIADKEYLKNANRMMVKYNLKHKVKEFHVGDCVTVRIPRIDRASTDPNRLP